MPESPAERCSGRGSKIGISGSDPEKKYKEAFP